MKQQSILDEPFRVSVPCIRVKQPIGEFFIAAVNSKTLCEITFADVRRMHREREVETYLGVQRPLNPGRVRDIQTYVRTVDACFPTSVILAVEGRCVEFDEATNHLVLKTDLDPESGQEVVDRLQIARVLDGQHRIEGLREYQGSEFEVNVSIFVDMDIENQAYIFSTVNLAQTKVNKSLVYDLFEYARSRSPQKTCHNIAVALDRLESSPFHKRIKRLGSATAGRFSETLTQATFVESLLPYLTEDKIVDRDLYMRGKKPAMVSAEKLRRGPLFRNMFLEERDLEIADVLLHYFEAISDRWPTAWRHGGEGLILNKTNGFKALMRLLRPSYLFVSSPGEVPSKSSFDRLFEKAKLEDEDFSVVRFRPGTSGQVALFHELTLQLGLP